MKKQWQQSYKCSVHQKAACSVCYDVFCQINRFVCPDCFTKQIHDHNSKVIDITNFENTICSQQMHHQHYIEELKNIKKRFIGQIDQIEQSISDNVYISYQSLRYLKSEQFSKYITYLFSNEEQKKESLVILQNSFSIFLKQMETFAEVSKLVEEKSFKTQILDCLNGEVKKFLHLENSQTMGVTQNQQIHGEDEIVSELTENGFKLIEWNSLQEAEEIFELILELRPQNEEAICGIGRLLQKNKMYDDSLIEFEKVLSLNSRNRKALYFKGESLRICNHNWEAIQCFEDILQQVQDNIDALISKGKCLRAMERFQESIDIFQQVLRLCPNNYDGLLLMGQTLKLMGYDREAKECIAKAIQNQPDL